MTYATQRGVDGQVAQAHHTVCPAAQLASHPHPRCRHAQHRERRVEDGQVRDLTDEVGRRTEWLSDDGHTHTHIYIHTHTHIHILLGKKGTARFLAAHTSHRRTSACLETDSRPAKIQIRDSLSGRNQRNQLLSRLWNLENKFLNRPTYPWTHRYKIFTHKHIDAQGT